MDKFMIEINQSEEKLSFEVIDFALDDDNRCKFEVFRENKFVASFEPDRRGILHVCKNPGDIDKEILHQIADKIEEQHW